MPANNTTTTTTTTGDSTRRDKKRRHTTQASNDTTSTSLTPLEERVLQQTTPYYNYSVFDDANILSMCDDETALLAASDPNTSVSGSTKTSAAADSATKADTHGASTGWNHSAGGSSATRTSGGVLDRYGGRLALRSKRLARMMVSQGRRNGSTNEGGTSYSSPRVPKLHATKDDNSSLSPPSLAHRRHLSHPQGKSRFHMIRPPRPSALFRSHGQRQAATGSHRVMDSGSFEMANYSGSGSTSTILQQQQQQQQQQQNEDKEKKNAARAVRRVRKAISRFIWPGGINRFGARDGGSYTEFVGFLLAFALASVAFIMWGTLVPKALCSTDMTFTMDAMDRRRFVAANGIVSDFTLTRSSFGSAMRGYSGYDITMLFPPLGQLSNDYWDHLPGKTQNTLENCLANQTTIENFLNTWRANSTLYRGEPDTFPSQCPLPEAPQTSGANCMVMDWGEFASNKVGMLKLNMTLFKDRHSSPTTAWVVIDNMVYDVSVYVSYVSEEIVVNNTVQSDRRLIPENMLLPEELTKLFIKNPGEDISDSFHSLKSDDLIYKPCMDALFLRGTTLTTKSPFACANTNIVAWVTFGFYFLILFSRMAIAEIHAQVRARRAVATLPASTGPSNGGGTDGGVGGGEESKGEGDEIAKCLVVVPCFREKMETLSGTLQGIARSAHDDAHKVLWIINDGDTEVLDGIMRILAHSGRSTDPKFYGAYGADSAGDGYGAARVHSGFYECGRHRIPYIVAAKETFQGSVDTIMMVLNFFRNLSSSSSSSSSSSKNSNGSNGSNSLLRQEVVAGSTIFLEEEIEAQMTALGHPPAGIDYCMMIDGGVQMDPLAITQFVARMETCPEIVALSGSLYPVGKATSVLQILRLFDFYLQYFVSPICESLANVTCPLNQLFCMYRVRLDNGSFCLGDEQFVASMDALMRGSIRCRHLTWPANDCMLVPRMTRRFPQCRWAFESNGRAEIELAAHRMAAFDPYERQWFRTRLMTLFDILRGRTLKRTWPIMLAHLMFPFVAPAAACMLYLEIVISIFGDSPAIVVSEITAGFVGSSLLLLLLSRRWAMALYFLVYCAIAVPFYLVWIPVTSFITMNRVWSPPEQLEARRQRVEQLDRPQELEEAMKRRFSNVHNDQEVSEKKRRRWRHKKQSSSSQSSSMGGGVEWRRRKKAVVLQMQQKQQLQQQQQQQQGGAGGGSSDSEAELVEETPMGNGALSKVVVGEGLAAETRRALQRVLAEYHPQRVEPESKEFYVVCERALMTLIQVFPQVSVPELAVAVDRTIDELLSTSSSASRGFVPLPVVAPYQTHKFTKQGSGSGYMGTGRPVSVILEEE